MGDPDINPFRFTGPVSPIELIDRDAEARRMLELAIEGNNSRLVAPRRYGKTSLLARVAVARPRAHAARRPARPARAAPADGELGEYLVERFEASGRHLGEALAALLDLVQGHPQRAMLAAHCLWRATPAGATASAGEWAVARADTLAIALEELEPLWVALPKGQKEVLDAIARGASPYGSQRTGATRGGAVAAAIRQLAAQGLIVERDPRGGSGRKHWRVVDPLLGAWAVERTNRRAAWDASR